MRDAWITGRQTMVDRLTKPQQVNDAEPEAAMPPYMESFLAHLRLLVGVPFEYLIPDPRLLPVESIRFFYLDRSWADRLVDGAISVGKIGTREQTHHQAHSPTVSQQLDLTERIVRPLQRNRGAFADLRQLRSNKPADLITGFLLRSAAVSGWPHMEVRAYSERVTDEAITNNPTDKQLSTLRLERLSPSVLLALFQGEPKLVVIEEPHHGVQFGVDRFGTGIAVSLRDARGQLIKNPPGSSTNIPLPLPVRAANNRVVAVAQLRRILHQLKASHPEMPAQTGSASLAIETLNPPWRQRFEGTKDNAQTGDGGPGDFRPIVMIGRRVVEPTTRLEVENLITA
jgi:hypothetical protein